MVRLLVPVPVPDLMYFNRAVPSTRVFSSESTELTKVSGTGMDVVPSLPKCRVRVMQGACTLCTLWYIPYRTKLCRIVFVSKEVEASRKYPANIGGGGGESSALYKFIIFWHYELDKIPFLNPRNRVDIKCQVPITCTIILLELH